MSPHHALTYRLLSNLISENQAGLTEVLDEIHAQGLMLEVLSATASMVAGGMQDTYGDGAIAVLDRSFAVLRDMSC